MEKIIMRKYNNFRLGLKITAPTKDYSRNKSYDPVVAYALVKSFLDDFPLLPITKKNDYQFLDNRFIIDNTDNERLLFRIELIDSKKQTKENLLTTATPEKWCFLIATDSNYEIMLLSNKNIYKEKRSYYLKRAEKTMDFLLNYIKENPKNIEIEE